jgi:hypothetical protein
VGRANRLVKAPVGAVRVGDGCDDDLVDTFGERSLMSVEVWLTCCQD